MGKKHDKKTSNPHDVAVTGDGVLLDVQHRLAALIGKTKGLEEIVKKTSDMLGEE